MEYSLRNSQLQKMMPQTLHSMQLLTLPLLLLKGYLGNLVLDNPFLEPRFDAMELPLAACLPPEEPSGEDDDAPPVPPRSRSGDGLLSFREEVFRAEEGSLYDHLRDQAALCGFDVDEAAVAQVLIANIGPAGYLDESVETVADTLGCEPARAERVLAVIQGFTPRGVGARDLCECLCLQADPARADYALLTAVLRDDLDALAGRQFTLLARKYRVSRPHIQQLLDYVRTLDPKPGSRFSAPRFTPYILPDATINFSGPRPEIRVGGEPGSLLTFNPDYMRDVSDAEAREFLRQKRQEAASLIGSLDMRYRALERLVGYLAVEQRAFFTDGPGALRPLTQKQAARDLGFHPSTVSRCVRDKYIATKWGSFPMSHFFSGGPVGGDCAAALARDAVAALIAQEDRIAPLSDLVIAERLGARGIRLSRRTVAKYRAALGLGGQAARRRYD